MKKKMEHLPSTSPLLSAYNSVHTMVLFVVDPCICLCYRFHKDKFSLDLQPNTRKIFNKDMIKYFSLFKFFK